MSASILTITSRLTNVAELIMEIDFTRLTTDELALLRERLPAWSLTLLAMSQSIAALEEPLRRE